MRIKAAEAIIKCLEAENTNVIFGYPGGAVLPLYEALRSSSIKHVLVRQEQSAAHMASGYGRALNSIGVCMATSGPGSTNLITGIATAYMDSIPLIAITGQVDSTSIGRDMFQEADIIGATESFTKNSYLVKDAKEIPRIFKEAFYIASTGRKGPVLIDIPKDIQDTYIDFEYPSEINIRGYKPTLNGNTRQVKRAVDLIRKSQKPIICAGGGIRAADANDALIKFVDKTKIPVVCSLMGVDAFPNDSPYFAGLLGSHGYNFVNRSMNESDLLIVIGARFADRSTSMIHKSSLTRNVIHIDIDPAEIGKNIETKIPIVGNAKDILNDLLEYDYELNIKEWLSELQHKRKNYMEKLLASDTSLNPKLLINKISKIMGDDGIWVCDVGINQIWAAHSFMVNGDKRFLTSGGLGTMGYSLPASIGAKIALPDTNVVASMGDGGFQMLMSDLALAREHNAGVKFIIFNNGYLGMVRELQKNTYDENSYFGITLGFNPDFMKLADAYSIKAMRISKDEEVDNAIDEMFKDNEPFILECIIDPEIPSVPRLGGRRHE
nr:biosynthetic-type acetolactate synthase large subunit [Sedimentibacter sp.]